MAENYEEPCSPFLTNRHMTRKWHATLGYEDKGNVLDMVSQDRETGVV